MSTNEEVWKQIEGFERYFISNKGRIKSTIGKEKILKQEITERGYHQIVLRKDNKSYHRRVHRLVALAFIETDDKTKEVHHIDRNRSNNKADNLLWVSKEEHNKIHNELNKAESDTIKQ